jgi:hypothetical protein
MSSTGIESSGPNLWIRERRFAKRMREANAKYDVFVISLPKSGRTWHRLMLGYYLARSAGQSPSTSLDLDFLCKQNAIRPLQYSHNCSSFSDKLPPSSNVVASPIEWSNRNVLFLIRDLRDVLVSGYFHCRYREKSFDGTISEYVRNPFVGIDKLLTTLNRWYGQRHLARKIGIISYEQMHQNPETALHFSLDFMGLPNPDPALIKEAVDFGRFDNLQQLESSNFFGAVEMRLMSNDPRGRKIRSGQIGKYREHLSADDLAFIAERERDLPNPFSIEASSNHKGSGMTTGASIGTPIPNRPRVFEDSNRSYFASGSRSMLRIFSFVERLRARRGVSTHLRVPSPPQASGHHHEQPLNPNS